MGKFFSSTHFHLESSTIIRPPAPLEVATELVLVGLGLLAPPPLGLNVNELTSNIERSPDAEFECGRAAAGGGGGKGAFERGDVALGGGGGGAELGEVVPPAAAPAAAQITACTARLGLTMACTGSSGGAGDRDGAGGGREARLGGGGGGAGGSDGAAKDGGGGAGEPGNGGAVEGLRLTGGGGGFFPIGGGVGFKEAEDAGRGAVVLWRFAKDGFVGSDGTARPGIAGAAPGGGLGAAMVDGFGAEDRVDSGSDR